MASTKKPLFNAEQWYEFAYPVKKRTLKAFQTAEITLGLLDKSLTKAYEQAYSNLNYSWDDVETEVERIIDSASHDTQKLTRLWDKYGRDLVILEMHNDHWILFREARSSLNELLAKKIGLELTLQMNQIFKYLNEQKFKRLLKLLEEAKDDVKEVEWQRGINTVISLVVLFATPSGFIAGVAFSVGAAVMKSKVDDWLGSKEGGVNAELTSVIQVNRGLGKVLKETEKLNYPKYTKVTGKALAGLGGVLTLIKDTDELDIAKARVAAIKIAIDDIGKEIERLNLIFKKITPWYQELIESIREYEMRLEKATEKGLQQMNSDLKNIDILFPKTTYNLHRLKAHRRPGWQAEVVTAASTRRTRSQKKWKNS